MVVALSIRYTAVVALTISVLALVWRAVVGPLHTSWLTMDSPLNAQSVVGLSATALLVVNSRREERVPTETRASLLWLPAILLCTLVALWRAIRFPLVFDDYTLVQYGREINVAAVKYYFTQPGGDGFFRPIGYLSFGLDAMWAATDPLRWHLTGLVLHSANVVLVWRLAVRIAGERPAAFWAAAVFAIHGTTLPSPMYRFDVLSVFFVLAGLLLFMWYLEVANPLIMIGSVVCMLLGTLTKETAFVFPLLAALLSGSKIRSQWRALSILFLLAAAVFVYRFSLLGAIGGYRDPATGLPQVFTFSKLSYLKGFGLRIWSAFYFPINWSHPLETWLSAILVVYLGVLAWITVGSHLSRSKVLTSLAFLVIALLPVSHLLLVNENLLGAGRFYLALAAFALMLGLAVRATPAPAQILVGAVLIVFQVAALRHNLAIWEGTAALVDRTCATAAKFAGSRGDAASAIGLPREIDGVPFITNNNGFSACVDFHRGSDTLAATSHNQFRWDPQRRTLLPE